ncbi:hypothetical protein F5Y17DRAFT_72637 [Xylariaceae sp. FL0594]|nr:hypothetical protein F5Y17DRAFT_72637 [Xylariaceae sp. FL0594]
MQLRSILFIFASALATTAVASPLGQRCGPGSDTAGPDHASPTTTSVNYVLPSTGGATSLPAPDAPLKRIAVGHGVQNYTCTTAGAKGSANGALAVLYDVTALYPGSGFRALSPADWDVLTSRVLRATAQPITPGGSPSPFPPPSDLWVPGVRGGPIRYLGHHFFDENNTPTFALRDNAGLFKGKKLANVTAPANADRGLNGEGAVDWLYLGDKGGSVGVSKVYRVLTAGGSPGVCNSVGGSQSVAYTAMYWMY